MHTEWEIVIRGILSRELAENLADLLRMAGIPDSVGIEVRQVELTGGRDGD